MQVFLQGVGQFEGYEFERRVYGFNVLSFYWPENPALENLTLENSSLENIVEAGE